MRHKWKNTCASPRIREENSNVILETGSGDYQFEYNTSLAVKVTKDAPEK